MKIIILIGLCMFLIACTPDFEIPENAPIEGIEIRVETKGYPVLRFHTYNDTEIDCYAECSPPIECLNISDFRFTSSCNENQIEELKEMIMIQIS